MILATIMHHGELHDRATVVICSITHTVHGKNWRTAILADGENFRGAFRSDSTPLFDIDHECGTAWVFVTKPPFGNITKEERLWLLLGYPIIVNEYFRVQALGVNPASVPIIKRDMSYMDSDFMFDG